MSSFRINGGKSLKGEIKPQGAKNEALQILCAVLLTDELVTIENVPDIKDVNLLIDLLKGMGVEINKTDSTTYNFKSKNIDLDYTKTTEFFNKSSKIRGSIMLMGPLVARFGSAYIAKPGGDKIGRRRVDTHFIGIQELGAKFTLENNNSIFKISSKKLKGKNILLDEASVTGTANIIMAASLSEGETTIYNAACEPYIQQLCKMLVSMGAEINGIGSNFLKIVGVSSLSGTTHKILPDMIEIGSFIGLAAMTKSDILIKDVSIENLGIIPKTFQRLGIKMKIENDSIHIPAQDHYEIESFIDGSIMTIADAIWPGFSPDLLSIALVTSIQAKGTVLIHQKMFESRLFFVDKLIDMGAQIILCDPHRATVIGLDRKIPLKGIQMTSPDIRAGVSLLIAALSAKGESIIDNIEQIDRGYSNIDTRLKSLGADIERI
ncbi:MAG: UDP-N-acetylglucosamine 1-carboxyvinyltransferase [Flammeovirgaceae bacterium]|nr:UDP-N-acetylglucosamine 1-carboxyvinyltransferase [Flammeovirgaceae bacterium]PDH48273.1 MAG: UDP-N-acetylglucosamine 1-carboxyvinyltransferase [Rhodothermaeota bacterium MED-G16]|tara:strand:- start:4338 stop:5642 length:1305 start_codon:yes stop_codon:yes gene_type:complete